MSATRSQQAFDNFSKALSRLEDALHMQPTEDTRDIAILRFMFTYETAWKAFKWVLQEKLLINEKAPRPILQEAYGQGWLGDDDTVWLNMAEDRNLVVHTYNEEQAQEIFEHIQQYATIIRMPHDLLLAKYPDLKKG